MLFVDLYFGSSQLLLATQPSIKTKSGAINKRGWFLSVTQAAFTKLLPAQTNSKSAPTNMWPEVYFRQGSG